MNACQEPPPKSVLCPAGDVYHLLFDLSIKIHGRVWLEKDRPAVKRLLSLIRHVCGASRSQPNICTQSIKSRLEEVSTAFAAALHESELCAAVL